MIFWKARWACALILCASFIAHAEENVKLENQFSFETVVAKAETMAKSSYNAPSSVPRFLQDLSYNDYQGIRFKPDRSLWRDTDAPFNVMLTPPGLFYTHPVKISIIDDDEATPLEFDKSLFTYANPDLEKQIPPDVGYAGFRLTFPFSGPDSQNQFLAFAGASYYRAVSKDTNFGISARGLAVDTGLPSGEEFPAFVEYWLEKPAKGDESFRFYALLDGPSISGAYQFTATPGDQTLVKVKAVLFPRKSVRLLGVAPLTSMFYYGENTLKPHGEWRPEVHDSDGLLIHNGLSNEWLWHPLRNPRSLRTDYFATENVQGFGLIQRDMDFNNYMDKEARYDTRPSTWIEPEGEWGKGQVVLVQIPTPDETNDNIVAFWRPDAPVKEGGRVEYAYTATFGGNDVANETLGRTVNTYLGDGNRVGGGDQKGAVRVIVDFSGGPLDKLEPNAPVVGSVSIQEGGEILGHFVEYIEPIKSWRLSILARPASGKPLALRAYLLEKEKTLTETWTYKLHAGSDVLGTIQ